MFAPTNNPYRFRYLVTSLTGDPITCHLPEVPPEIHCKKEDRFTHHEMPEYLRKAVRDRDKHKDDPNFTSPYEKEIQRWEDTEWERSTNGFWFWNKGVPTYLTGFHYWFLTAWHPYFGQPLYRETDKEICYWIQFWEEDPNSYGGALNTIRRYGKSSLMGAWIVYRATRNFNHTAGMQGENDKKIASFYRKMVLKPFYKLPSFYQPEYNTDNKQASKIEFDQPPRRSQKRSKSESEDLEVLESIIDFRASGEGEYDGEILHSYLCEEPGKLLRSSLYDEEGEGRWDIVKPCFLSGGEDIIGKAFLGTTVENLKATDRGGLAYKRLFYDSDYNKKEADGRTMSGLYAAFLPGQFAMKKYIDAHGHPMVEEAKKSLLTTRQVYAKRPSKLAGWIRKYPMTVSEIFYVNPDSCAFNSQVLQDRALEIDLSTAPMVQRIDLYWENGVKDSKVKWRHNPQSGWCQVAVGIGFNEIETNLFEESGWDIERNVKTFRPKNTRFAIGCDPIEHGVTLQPGKSSKPVICVKSRYDSSIDGLLSEELMEQRAAEKYQYKTNRYILLYDFRPTDPNKFFEYAIMICAFFGTPIHVESQKYSLINYFYSRGYGEFILNKYKPDFKLQDKTPIDGTAASQPLIQEYTIELESWINNFGHTQSFRELIEDNLVFDPTNTKVHDYSVSMGFTELACKMKPKNVPQPVKDIKSFFRIHYRDGTYK